MFGGAGDSAVTAEAIVGKRCACTGNSTRR